MDEEIPPDIADTLYEALDAMKTQSPEHRGPHAPSTTELSEAMDWVLEHTE